LEGVRKMIIELAVLGIFQLTQAFDPSVRPKCFITGQAVEGPNQINSPQYPNPFKGRLQCLYILTAPVGKRIELEFDDFSMSIANNRNCKNSGLAILDPRQTAIPGETVIYCGKQKPNNFVTKGNEVFLMLQGGQGMGQFQIVYRIAPEKSVRKPGKKGPNKGAPAPGRRPGGAQVNNRKPKNKSFAKKSNSPPSYNNHLESKVRRPTNKDNGALCVMPPFAAYILQFMLFTIFSI
jgi:hypothetical protein